MTELEFWEKVYLAVIRSGKTAASAKWEAATAVAYRREALKQ